MSLSPKKLILLGLGVILLIAIPLTVFVVQKQQQTRSNASPATNLSFVDPTTQPPATTTEAAPKTVAVGAEFSFDVVMNPGANVVGGLTLIINYDSTKLGITGQGITPNTAVMGNLLGDIKNTAGQIEVSFSPAAADPTKAITQTTTIGTVTLKALAVTDAGTPTQIKFDTNTIVAPIGSGDTNSNVLAGSPPAFVVIVAQGEVTPTPTLTPVPSVTTQPTATPVPQATATPEPTAIPTQPVSTNQIPVCSSLAIDVPTSGTAPYTVNFTATGTDSDGTIGKVSFNFGEGAVQDVTSGGGIGTNNINVPASHIYSSAGTFTASAVLTDNSSGVSTACSQAITVSSGVGTGTPVGVTQAPVQQPTATATPTLAATGPGQTIVGIGVLGILFSVIGAIILFAL